MSASDLPLIISSIALLGVSGVVALRLLWLAWRTGEVPERLMGLGLGGLLFVYFPMMAMSGMGRAPVGDVNVAMLASAAPFFVGGFACLVCFTWRVFRPQAGWAVVLAFGLSLAVAGLLGAVIGALHASPPEADSFKVGQLWTGLLRLPMIAAFLWTGLEGARSWSTARRRLELGLIDAAVTNRFLLWAIVGVAQVVLQTVSTVLHFQGLGMMASPVGLLVVSIGASVGSAALFLVFLPPRAYLRVIERRAATAQA